MAPARPKRASANKAPPPASESDDASSRSQEASQSQELDVERMQQLVNKSRDKVKVERMQRQEELQRSKKQRIDKVQKKLADCRKKHDERLRTLRRPKIERLRHLLQRKRELETKIQECWARVDVIYEATLEQYRVAVKGRLHELQNA